jgi:hypothetical protein
VYAVDVQTDDEVAATHIVGRGRIPVAIVALDIEGSTVMTISAKARSREAMYDIFEKFHIIYLAGVHGLGFHGDHRPRTCGIMDK